MTTACQAAFEKWHGFSVGPDMDIATEIAWEYWVLAWNSAINFAAGSLGQLARDGKGVSGPVDRAMVMAIDEVTKLKQRGTPAATINSKEQE